MTSQKVDVFISPRDEYFEFNLKYLFYVGLWPYKHLTMNQRILYKVYEITLHILSIYYVVVTNIGSYNHRHDMKILMSNLDKSVIGLTFVLKTFCYMYNRKKFQSLIDDIMDSEDMITYKSNLIMKKLVCIITVLVTITVSGFSLVALYEGEMTVEAWMPFDPMESRMNLLLSAQILAATFLIPCAWRATGLQGIICSVMMYFCEQYQELQRRLRVMEYSPENELELREELMAIIRKHVRLMRYALMLREILDNFFFFHNLSITIEMCLNALMVSIVGTEDKKTLTNFLVFLLAALFNTFVYCYLANQMIVESEGISQAAYESPWPSWPTHLQKDLLTVLTVSQRSLKLTAGGVSVVSLHTYSQLMYNGYSIYTVLHDMM